MTDSQVVAGKQGSLSTPHKTKHPKTLNKQTNKTIKKQKVPPGRTNQKGKRQCSKIQNESKVQRTARGTTLGNMQLTDKEERKHKLLNMGTNRLTMTR